MRHRIPGARATLAAAVLAALPGALTAQEQARPDRIDGHPNLNGVWQAVNTAHWNLEGHDAEALDAFWELGAFGAIPPGQSVVEGGEIPYLPEAREQREENRANWPEADPAAKCYMPGIPRANYQPYPFQIVQGDGDMLFAYQFASSHRNVYMNEEDHLERLEVPVDQWMGWSNGRWEGDTLVIEVVANDDRTWLDRSGNWHSNLMTVTERFTKISDDHIRYEATIEDPEVFSEAWTISMPLYRRVEANAELLEYKCVEFSEPLLYGEFLKEPVQ